MAKNMTARALLRKANSKAGDSAVGFVAAYREYILSEISEAAPIIDNIDAGNVCSIQVMSELKQAILLHIQNVEEQKLQEAIEKANVPHVSCNRFLAEILNVAGEIQDSKSFKLPQEADRWCDRQLEAGAVDWHATIFDCASNKPWSTIKREDSIYRIMMEHRGKKPVCRLGSKTTSRLTSNMKAKQSRAMFSCG